VISLGIDGFGTKWIGGNPGIGKGLIYYNDNNTPDDLSDDITGILTESEYDELLSNEHSSIVYDYNRILWVGTPGGLVAIANLNFMFYNSKPIIRSVPILLGQPINDIIIDPQNRKWVATTKGVWVIDENGNNVLAHITMDNSPISTDDVKSINLNENTGEIYLGTQNGLFVANTLSIKPLEQYKITCYPQPFRLNKDTEIAIDGLGSVSEVRILTISGGLVKVFNTESRKFMWNGKDENGNQVPPGVYLIVAKSGDSSASGVGKIAIVRD
jgi:ligand-binding sensor domain-containing protein